MTIEIGVQARLVQPVVQGDIVDTRFNKDAKQLEHLVHYIDAAGDPQHRWFFESDLEEVHA